MIWVTMVVMTIVIARRINRVIVTVETVWLELDYLLVFSASFDLSNRTEMFDWGGQPNARTMFPKVPSSSLKARGHSKSSETHLADLEPERDWLGPRG